MARYAWLLLLLPLGCGGPAGKYESEAGRFRVYLPGFPSSEADPELPRGVFRVALVQRSGSYTVAWEDLAEKPADPVAYLDDACTRANAKLKGKERARKSIQLPGEHPGRELELAWPDGKGVVRHRMYLVGQRLYHVSASGPEWWVESPTSRKVIESFELTGP